MRFLYIAILIIVANLCAPFGYRRLKNNPENFNQPIANPVIYIANKGQNSHMNLLFNCFSLDILINAYLVTVT